MPTRPPYVHDHAASDRGRINAPASLGCSGFPSRRDFGRRSRHSVRGLFMARPVRGRSASWVAGADRDRIRSKDTACTRSPSLNFTRTRSDVWLGRCLAYHSLSNLCVRATAMARSQAVL